MIRFILVRITLRRILLILVVVSTISKFTQTCGPALLS